MALAEPSPYTWTSLDRDDESAPYVRTGGRGRVAYANGDGYAGGFDDAKHKHGRGAYTWSTAPGAHAWVPADGFAGEGGG